MNKIIVLYNRINIVMEMKSNFNLFKLKTNSTKIEMSFYIIKIQFKIIKFYYNKTNKILLIYKITVKIVIIMKYTKKTL